MATPIRRGPLVLCASLPLVFALLAAGAPTAWAQARHTRADDFIKASGTPWRVVGDPATGNPRFVYGGRYALFGPRSTPEQYAAAARALVDRHAELFGFSGSSLVLLDVKRLPLSRLGTSDKVVALFQQVEDGIPVLEGTVSVLFDERSGDAIAVDTQGAPGASTVRLLPRSSGSDAIGAAQSAFAARYGFTATEVGAVEAVIATPTSRFGLESPLRERGPVLAYRIELGAFGRFDAAGVPAEAEAVVSAEGDLTVFRLEPTAFAAIGGTIKGNVNTGVEPNTSSNQEQPTLAEVYVRDAATNAIVATGNASGAFSIADDTAFNGYVELAGPRVKVTNKAGANARIDLAFGPGSNTTIVFNPSLAEFTTAEVAAFHWATKFRDWVKSVDPSETKMDSQVKSNVNLNDTCNAYFSGGIGGGSVNFFHAGGGCTNTAYKSVCHHEEGHLANAKYNGGVSGAFHEGNADAWAYHISDDPCLYNFGGGGCLRNGEQTAVKKCAIDGDESCHGGEPHEEGQAIASAMWAVRKNLKASLGVAAGGAAASDLFLSWMQAFDDRQILNVINDHFIALDDDDGNLFNYTPHFATINSGFQAYNWPALVIPDLTISLVSSPEMNGYKTPNQPVTITADANSNFGVLTGIELRYSIDGGTNYIPVAMAPTGVPKRYSAAIPGQGQGSRVRWYVRATGSVGGAVLTEPKGAPSDVRLYVNGYFQQLAGTDFEALTDDEGYTHVNLSGSNGDQWTRSDPSGSEESTDPKAAHSGARVWGTDLSITGSDGKYEPSSSGELRTPVLNFTGSSNVILQFRRWLAVEKGSSDQATVRVNGTTVWSNPTATNLIDTAWSLQEIDISALAANNPSVQISWRLAANGSTEFGGWNVDDVVIYRVDPPFPGYFETYADGCPGSYGVAPTLKGIGAPSSGNAVSLELKYGLPVGSGTLFLATAQGSYPLGGGCSWLLGGTLLAAQSMLFDFTGKLTIPAVIPPVSAAGDAYLQFLAVDPLSVNGEYTMSNGLHVHVE